MFAVDTCDVFGIASGAGLFGLVADVGADLFRAAGIRPLLKWVDDHIFFRIPIKHLRGYNQYRREKAIEIQNSGGQKRSGGVLWFQGSTLPDGRVEKLAEDYSFPLVDHKTTASEDVGFAYGMTDIDAISDDLGLVWELLKDAPFSTRVLQRISFPPSIAPIHAVLLPLLCSGLLSHLSILNMCSLILIFSFHMEHCFTLALPHVPTACNGYQPISVQPLSLTRLHPHLVIFLHL